jgi:hypothetical protein
MLEANPPPVLARRKRLVDDRLRDLHEIDPLRHHREFARIRFSHEQ